MSIQQSTELIIFVTHVEAEDAFLKIWGQVDKNSATCVERMILPLVEQFARSQGCIGPQAANLHINALCCARFQNDGYYRAKVINIRTDGMVVLQFIDYGNVEVLSPQEIHLLENIPGSESLQSFPPVAFDFTLMNVLPINGTWENKIIESIKKTLWYNEYKVLIHSVINNHRLIKLWYNNEDFSELLINRHMAIRTTLQDMFRVKCVQQPQVSVYLQSSKRLTNNCITVPMQNINPVHCDGNEIHGFQRNVPLCCAVQQKHMMQNSVQEALVFKSRVLDVPSKHDVYVSFVEDGPHKFSVQLQSTSQILSMLMRDINSHPIKPLQEPPLPGSVCLGRYTQDKVLCRAVVMSVMENKCKLYYVDFGHTELLPYTDIFQLPSHFINPKVLSIRFTLSGVHELNVTDEMKGYFKQIVSGKLLVLHVRPPEGPPLVQYGDLYDDGKNIKDILRQAFPAPITMVPITASFAYQEPRKLSKNMEEIVHVSFVESCKKFCVQLDSSIEALELIMNNLKEFCTTAPTLNLGQLKIGLPCAALYENQWYRAKILGINGDNIRVLYVDYGNEETVPLMSLRIIRDDLVKKLQAQAIKCILNGWELLPSTQEVHNQFEMLILERRLRLRVVDTNVDGIVVDLYEPEEMENIKSLMLHIIGSEKKTNESPNYQTMDSQHTTKITSKVNQRFCTKLQMNLVQQWKNKMNIEETCESASKWHKKKQVDSWHQVQSNNTIQEKSKFKTWKDESVEGKVHENRSEKSNFHRNDSRSERFNRDDFSSNKNVKDKWSNKNEYNDSFKSGKGTRGGRNKTSGFVSKSHSDKSWSDKDSDTSSRGSSRRGRGSATRGNYFKREGISARLQNKFSDRDNDGNFRSTRTNSDSYHGNNRFRERKGQGYRLTQNRLNTINSMSEGEARRYSPMKSRNEFHIPSPNITVGAIKTCEVVFTNSLSDFFVQLTPDYTSLDCMMENIASIYENGGEFMKESEILKGAYCIAQYSEDLKWYRAMITSVEGNNATVQFVDYGNTETIEFKKIKSIQKEFLKLPIQAIHCKLFGIKTDNLDKNKIKNFEDTVTGKTLEIEFVIEENGIYSVLLKEMIDGVPANTFINQEFCENNDLLKAKEDTISSNRTVSSNTRPSIEPNYAPLSAKWTSNSYKPGTKKDVIVTWFTNPNNFYCQILDNATEFRTMMNEIQKIYVGREPISQMLQVGSPVIAIFSDDGALYRAEIIELNELDGHLVQYVDFGNSAVVNPQKVYPVETKLMHLAKQAVQCSLLNIIPQNEISWSKVNTEAIDKCFNADKYECIFHDIKDDKYLIELLNNGNNVANTLVERNLAAFNSETKSNATIEDYNATTPTILYNLERVDINLLSGQALRVKVSSVESTTKLYIQLPSAAACENMIDTYMANKNPKVMQRLSTHEICLGTGCLVYSNGVWRRAVISSHSQSTGFDVKFIDTGVYDEIFSDSVLALPGELSVMQNQAVECSLLNGISTPEANVKLKECVEGKEVIVYIDEVDNNRLIVKLFDLSGNKINIFEDSDEKISPICPLPILSSTHKVSVSYADHCANIWLQRNAEYALDKNLAEALYQYYSTSGKLAEPKVGLLCAVKSVDNHWYRAKIIKCSETGIYVNFIDYGNNEEVTPDAVMILDSQFFVPHQLAVNVSLPVTLNGTISEQLNILQSYLSNKDLTAVFYNVNKKWVVELLHEGEKISDKLRSFNVAAQQEISGIRQPQIHNLTVGCKYDVYVSHVDSPSQFWLQCVDDISNLSNKQEELQTQAPGFPQIDGILEEGSLCIAVYTIDNLWYRAQVLDADEDITTVRFIDYGNTDVIDNKSGNIRQIPDSWKEIKEYAARCRLDVIPVDTEDWNVTTCEKFENLVTSTSSLQAVIIATNSIPKRIDLLMNGKSVSETLVEDHHAVKIHTEEELIDEIVDLELDPHSAFVSHINSPNEFWVQEEKSVGDLEIMTDRFIVAHMFPKVDEIKENLLCVAKYPEDECWYRARVISHSDNATRVIYIDYGNSATSTEIRAIPADLANIPPLSRKCHLTMPEGITEWSQKACEEFIKLAADGATIFLLDVLKEDETSLVKLTLDGKNVTDILANFCECYLPIIEERLPPLGEENSPNVFISRVNSPNEFWIQTESSTTDLFTMSERLQAAVSFLPLTTFEIGTICVAKYSEDNQWYRVKILSHSDHGAEVLYIDYGGTAVTNDLRMLPIDIINIPPLSKCCALQKPDSINNWSSDACKIFEELAANGETIFQFEILDDTNTPMYVKLNLNGKNITDVLLSFCENMSEGATIKESENSCKNEDMNTKNCESIETEHLDETEGEETCDAYDADVSESPKDTEIQNQENANNLSSSSILELSVDEIVQNMKVDEPEENEEIFRSHDSTIRSNEKDNVNKVTKNIEHSKEVEVDVQSNKEHTDTKTVKEEVLVSLDENRVKNLEEKDEIIKLETQVCNNEMAKCEPNINTQCCEKVEEENTSQPTKFSNEQSEKVLQGTSINSTFENVVTKDTNVSSSNEEENCDAENCKIQVTEKANVKDHSEVKSVDEKIFSESQFVEIVSNECKITDTQQDTVSLIDKVNDSITDPEGHSKVKSVDEKISELQSVEVGSNECKMTDTQQDTVSLIDTTNIANSNESNDAENSSQIEMTVE